MDITADDIESITTAIWATILEQELRPDPGVRMSELSASHVGIVELRGAFDGVVAVYLSEGMVRGAASRMFDAPAREIDEDQIVDTVAELTNMVGGNVKCLVPQPTGLGLPTVHAPHEVGSSLGAGLEIRRLGFTSADGGVLVEVHRLSAA